MDHFGIGTGVAGAAKVYFQSSRRTGRTTSLVDSLKDGDVVVFLNEREGQRVKSLCKDRGVDIEIVVCNPAMPERLFTQYAPLGDERFLFDHSWVEAFYMRAIDRAQNDIDRFQKEFSGRGEAHRETERQAREIMKWEM